MLLWNAEEVIVEASSSGFPPVWKHWLDSRRPSLRCPWFSHSRNHQKRLQTISANPPASSPVNFRTWDRSRCYLQHVSRECLLHSSMRGCRVSAIRRLDGLRLQARIVVREEPSVLRVGLRHRAPCRLPEVPVYLEFVLTAAAARFRIVCVVQVDIPPQKGNFNKCVRLCTLNECDDLCRWRNI